MWSRVLSEVKLHLDWCSYKAAKFAVEHWHYSKRLPVGKSVKIGVWENNKYIGCVIFSLGNNRHIGDKFNLSMFEICELTRVALTTHITHVTRIISISIRLLKKHSPNIKAILSYADPEQGHEGGIYKAGNWIYLGESAPSTIYVLDGKKYHSRVANPNNTQFGKKTKRPPGIEKAEKIKSKPKHKFIYYLDKTLCANSVKEHVSPSSGKVAVQL
jgi:hypothetical protein